MSTNNLRTLNEIFENSFFRIPDYQRGYAWEKSQLDDFWEDLENMSYLNTNKNHYTGMITVEMVERENIDKLESWIDDLWLFEKKFKAYYVIDGQQRLTTVIILIKNILDKADEIFFESKENWEKKFLFQKHKEKFCSYIFGYERDNPSNEYFITEILKQKSATADKYPQNTLYTLNLKDADEYFKEKLKNLNTAEIEEIFKKVITGLHFNFYEVSTDLDVFVTFETMNNRGKNLTNLELLKNRLIYLSNMINDEKSIQNKLRKNINESWKTIYEYLGKNIKKRLDDDDFLRNHWIMFFKYDRNISNPEKEFLLKEYFTLKQLLKKDIGYNEIDNYRENIQEAVKNWYFIHNPRESTYSEELKFWLDKLNRIGFGAFKPLVLALFIRKEKDENILEILKYAEKYVFLVFKISDRKSSTGNSQIYGYSNSYFTEEITFDVLLEKLNSQFYYYYEDEQFYNWVDLDRFINLIDENYRKNSNGFYGWNGLKYFLYEYELFIKESTKRKEEKILWDTINQESIEHIFPQTETDKWGKQFTGVKKEKKEKALHSIGNLLLLANSKNSELLNKSFEEKKEIYSKGSYSEIEVSKNNNWGMIEIKERGIKMLKFLSERWDITIDDEKMEDILKL